MSKFSRVRWLAVMMVPIMLLSMAPVTASAEVEPIVTDNFAFIPNSAEASVSKVNLDPAAPPGEVARYSTIEPRPGAYNLPDYRVSRLAIDEGGNAWALNTMTGQSFPGFASAQGSVARISADPVPGEDPGVNTSNSSTIVANDVRVSYFNLGAPGDGPRTINIVEEGGVTYLWIGFYVGNYFEKYMYDADAGTLTVVPDTRIDLGDYTPYYAALDADGIMWVTSRNASPYPTPAGTPGVLRFDTANIAGGYEVLPYTVSGESNPYAIIVASDGKVWVSDGGQWGSTKVRTFAVYDDSGGPVTVEYVPTTGAPSQAMRGFIEYEGAIWASAIDGQVLKGTPGTPWTWEVVKSGLGELTGIGPDAFGYLWVVQLGSDAIYRFDPDAPELDNISVGVGDQPYAYGEFVVTVQYAELGDFVWEDLNHNGVQDAGEPGIEGVKVYLWECDGEAPLAMATTDADGEYLFSDLMPGDYKLQFELPDGFVFTAMNQGGDPALDSDADTSTGITACTTLVAGETDLTWDAGMYRVYDFCGYKWLGETDTGIASWMIFLERWEDEAWVPVADTLTDATGRYCFSGLPAGTYRVFEAQKAGWTQLYPVPNEHIVVLPAPAMVEGPVPGSSIELVDQGLRKDGTPVRPGRSVPEAVLTWDGNHVETDFFSLGFGGEIVVAFDCGIPNGEGNDVLVVEDTWGTSYPLEKAEVYASKDGVDWAFLGTADNTTRSTENNDHTVYEFDLGDLSCAKYIKVVDVTDPAIHAADGDGYDLNVVLALHGCCPPNYDFRNVPNMECWDETAMAAQDEPGVFRFVPAPGNWFTYITYNMDDEYTAEAPRVYPIYAGQTYYVGDLLVYDEGGKVYVKYLITETEAPFKAGYCGGWTGITEYHLQVVDEFAQFDPYRSGYVPKMKKQKALGSIIPGALTDKGCYEFPTADTGWIEATTGALNGEVFIAAHSVASWCGYPCDSLEEAESMGW